MKEIIKLDNIKRDFKVGDETVHALRGVSFTIYEGEFVTIMGTSGSGKSTLLNTLGCLDTPTSGEYYLDGTSVRTMGKNARATLRNRKIGFVFQNYNLLPKTTAVENVELPLMYNPSYSAADRHKKAVESLVAVGLGVEQGAAGHAVGGLHQSVVGSLVLFLAATEVRDTFYELCHINSSKHTAQKCEVYFSGSLDRFLIPKPL